MSECNCGCRIRLNVQEDSPVSLQVLDGDKVRVGCADFLIRTDKDYNHLENKPSVNGVTLEGNKSLQDLGIDLDDFVTSDELATVATSGAYSDLTGKPQINNVELVGNKSLADLGITSAITEAIAAYIESGAYLIIAKLVENIGSLVEYRSLYSPLSYNDLYAFLTDTRPVYFLINGNIGHLEFAGEDVDNAYSVIISTNGLNGVNEHYWFHASSQSEHLTGSLNPLTTYYGLGNGDVEKLNGIESGAQVNVQSDWDVSNPSSDAYIKNKPSIPTNTSDLTNDSDFVTSTDVETAMTPVSFRLYIHDDNTVTTSFTFQDFYDAISDNKPYIFWSVPPLMTPSPRTLFRVSQYTRNPSGNNQIMLECTESDYFGGDISYISLTSTGTNNMSGTLYNKTIPTRTSQLTNNGSDNTSTYLEADEVAYGTKAIPYGVCDNTSTSTAFTATVPGITELRNGVCMLLKNGVVTSAAGFTININGLGAKPSYSNMAAATADTTLFNINYTMLFVYDETRVSGGCWICYRGYNSDTNTIGYQLRTNSSTRPVATACYRYRLLFSSPDNSKWVPANSSSSTNATALRNVTTEKINPFGDIRYYSYTSALSANANVGTSYQWDRYSIALGYSFNRTGAALTLTYPAPVYIKCAPNSDGSANIDTTTPYVQALPSTEDGKIYIYLGQAYSATNVELISVHPVYYYKDGAIREWTDCFVPTKTSDLTNDSGFITDAGVTSFNGSTGAVTYSAPVSSVNGQTGAVTVTEGLAPLIGTTSNTTPTQVKTAIEEGRDVAITYTSPTYGVLKFCNFNSADTLGAVVSQTIIAYNGQLLNIDLVGEISNGQWSHTTHIFIQSGDNISSFVNDSGYLTSADAVTSFNGQTGAVTYAAPVSSVNGQTGDVSLSIPTKTSDLNNDSGFITSSDLDSKENVGKITVNDIEYTVTRKALSITDNGVTTTYYVADIT